MFESERLAAALARLATPDPMTMVHDLIAELDSFASGVEPDDDQTLLLVAIE